MLFEELTMERSLVLVKPDAMQRNLGCTILSRFESKGLKLVALRMLHVDEALAKKHYAVHADKPFFAGLITFITSYPILAAVYKGENAVEEIRKTMGSTDPKKAQPGTVRHDFGLDIERNSVHGSDSRENAEKEISLFFAKKEIFE
jgi:nucleoside-diphosphate kinase